MEDAFKVLCGCAHVRVCKRKRETIPMLYCDPNHRAIN